jgi:hypothetical protein
MDLSFHEANSESDRSQPATTAISLPGRHKNRQSSCTAFGGCGRQRTSMTPASRTTASASQYPAISVRTLMERVADSRAANKDQAVAVAIWEIPAMLSKNLVFTRVLGFGLANNPATLNPAGASSERRDGLRPAADGKKRTSQS